MATSPSSYKIPKRVHRSNNLEIISQETLSKYRVKGNKLIKNLYVDHYHFYQRNFFPDLKRLRPLAKAVTKVRINLTSMGMSTQECFRKTIDKLSTFRCLKKFHFICSTVLVIPESVISAILLQVKSLKDLKEMHFNFLRSFLTTRSLCLIYQFHAIRGLESLILKVPSAKCIQKRPQQSLQKIYKKLAESRALKRKLKGFEVTIDSDENNFTSGNTINAKKTTHEDKDYVNILKYLDNIERLKLNFANGVLPKISTKLIQYLQSLGTLRSLALKLHNEVINSVYLEEILSLIKCLDLQSLELKASAVEIINVSFCNAIVNLANLKVLKLDIRQQKITQGHPKLFMETLEKLKALEHLKLKFAYPADFSIGSFYYKIISAIQGQGQRLKTLQLYNTNGILNEKDISCLVEMIPNMKHLKDFGIAAKNVDGTVSEELLTRFFGSMTNLLYLNKLKLDFSFSSEMKIAIKELLSSVQKLSRVEKLILYCPYSAQDVHEIADYYNELCRNQAVKMLRINLPYFENLKSLTKPRTRKLIPKSVYWNMSYRIIYDLYF